MVEGEVVAVYRGVEIESFPDSAQGRPNDPTTIPMFKATVETGTRSAIVRAETIDECKKRIDLMIDAD